MTPSGGWYLAQGGNTDVGFKGADRAERSKTLDRLTKTFDDQLPDTYTRFATGEIRQDSCALRRSVVLQDPDTGAFAAATWEQLKASRSRETAPHTGPLTWQVRTDGGAMALDGSDSSVHAVLLVVGDGRYVYVLSRGKRSNHLGGYPTPTTAKGPLDPAPLSVDQLKAIAERMVGADQG